MEVKSSDIVDEKGRLFLVARPPLADIIEVTGLQRRRSFPDAPSFQRMVRAESEKRFARIVSEKCMGCENRVVTVDTLYRADRDTEQVRHAMHCRHTTCMVAQAAIKNSSAYFEALNKKELEEAVALEANEELGSW